MELQNVHVQATNGAYLLIYYLKHKNYSFAVLQRFTVTEGNPDGDLQRDVTESMRS
jgi:hypothetical protein